MGKILENLIHVILSWEDYMDFVAQVDYTTPADAKNLLDFVLGAELSDGFEGNADVTQRARLFLLKIMSKTYIEPLPNQDDLENYCFPLLLYSLNCYSLVCDTSNPEIALSRALSGIMCLCHHTQ
jgi:hypothetical protein